MADPIAPNKTEYPGDAAFAAFLSEHECPLPLHIVKFRFWGLIVSIAMRVSPVDEIKAIWDGVLPELEDEKDAQKFLDVMFSLWNGLAQMNLAGHRLRLSQRHGLDNPTALKR